MERKKTRIDSIREIGREKGIKIRDTIYGNSNTHMLDFRIVSGDFYEPLQKENGKYAWQYKNCVEIMDFPMMKNIFPQLDNFHYSGKDKLPYFTAGLRDIAYKIQNGKKAAIEGGPCLFGTDEVMVKVTTKAGTEEYFDYNTGKSYLQENDNRGKMDFGNFMKKYGREIKAIDFVNKKVGLTPQEWIFIKFPFEMARVFSAPLVIPIPDMSYIKYLEALLSYTEDKVKEETLCKFRTIVYKISDQYLELIDRLQSIYKEVHCEVVHERNKKLIEKYYREREPYMEKRKVLRNLTGIPEKLESVKDYVSMPALPYYLYGIDTIIEVDSMDETDSFRKCRKAHKGSLNLACILLPEFLSRDKKHTIFDAPRSWKEYGAYVVE